MEVLELNGKRYSKASTAAREVGYAVDYVGQLCRAGKIDAQLVGRSWYVPLDELRRHKDEAKRSSRLKARQRVKETLEKERAQREQHTYEQQNGVAVAYAEDQGDTLPHIEKPHEGGQPSGLQQREGEGGNVAHYREADATTVVPVRAYAGSRKEHSGAARAISRVKTGRNIDISGKTTQLSSTSHNKIPSSGLQQREGSTRILLILSIVVFSVCIAGVQVQWSYSAVLPSASAQQKVLTSYSVSYAPFFDSWGR